MDRDKVYHVLFHDDVDGIISAAIFLHKLLESNETYRLYPVSSQSRGEKFESLIKSMKLKETDNLIILDYEYHSKCDLWVDHHFSPTMGNEQVIHDKIVYDPNAKSAASLLLSHGAKYGYVYGYNTEFIETVDMIDKAEYKSVNQIFSDTHPLMILRAYVERTFHSEMMFSRIIEMLANTNFDFRKALYQLKINKKVIWDLQADVKKTSREMVICGNFSIIRQSRPGKFPRYAEFYIKPEIKYSVRLSRISMNKIYFQIGSNKWHQEPNNINIGKMLSGIKYLTKGGGHYSVGGGIVDEDNCEKLIDDLSINLNEGNESMTEEMEKVGVDKENDPIEAKAEEMVKTGEAKSIDDARKKAVDKSEEKEKTDAAGA